MRNRQTPNSQGYSIVEVMIAAVIIAVCALGLGSAISHLSASRKKTQLISQAVGVEASLVSALQSPESYDPTSSNHDLLSALKASDPSVPLPHQPTNINVVVGTDKSFKISAGGSPVYIDSTGGSSSASGNWAVKTQLSPLALVNNHYAYSYTVSGNPAIATIANMGAKDSILAPINDVNTVPIPKEILTIASQDSTSGSCRDGDDDTIGMLGLDNNGSPICVVRSKGKCAKGTIPKGFVLTPQTSNTYSYEFKCVNLKVLNCSAQLTDGGVPDPSLHNPYVLQSFSPNTLDSSGGAAATGSCVFLGADSSAVQNVGTFHNGVSVTGACPAHYSIASVNCAAGANDANPGPLSCAGAADAVPVPPSGTPKQTISGNNLSCQSVVTKVCCGDDHTKCAGIWTGSVKLSYQCILKATVVKNTPAS